MKKGMIFDIKGYAIHDGPGIRSSIFFKGCPLNCIWCHNPESQSPAKELIVYHERCLQGCRECVNICPTRAIQKDETPRIFKELCSPCSACENICPTNAIRVVGEKWAVKNVLDEVEKDFVFYDQSGGGITITGGEPLMQPVFLKEILEEASARSIRTIVDTCGYAAWNDFESIIPLVDVFYYDLKILDKKKHLKYTGKGNQRIINNLKKLSEVHKNIEVRIPIIPGITDSKDNIDGILNLLTREVSGVGSIALLKYHTFGDSKLDRLELIRNKIEYRESELKERIIMIKEKFEKNGFYVSIGG